MAQKVQVVLVDDVDGGKAEETVAFSLDGVSYEIDLSSENAARLRDALANYVGNARRIGGSKRTSRGRGNKSGLNPADVRAWAKTQGITVSERGRISAELQAQYQAARA
ncbi:MAG: Lsr2 family protein [Actinomycetes bacterium]